MMIRWGILCEFLPEPDGTKKIRLSPQVFDSEKDAKDYQRQVRLENLPFKAHPFSFEDPRDVI